jgi:hypothetical protein
MRTMSATVASSFLVPALVLGGLALAGPAAATPQGGSDAPVPYTVAPDGLTLPDGATFQDGGHVNVRYTVDGVESGTGIHFETLNDQPSGRYVGESFLPWSELIDEASYCVSWVQVSQFDEHFGEGGQEPVCTDDQAAPSATPTPSTSATPSVTPTTSATPGTPAPAGPTPADEAAPAGDAPASAIPSPSGTPTTAGDDGVLAATGSMAVPVTIFAGLLIAGGVVLVLMGRRVRRN